MNDIVINKIQSIQRCIERAREEYNSNPEGFDTDHTAQDAALLNVLRACEQTMDLANHVIKVRKMGVPTSSAESFDLLMKKKVIDANLAEKLRRMTGFRNTVIHEYQQVDLTLVKQVIALGLDDLIEFGDLIVKYLGDLVK